MSRARFHRLRGATLRSLLIGGLGLGGLLLSGFQGLSAWAQPASAQPASAQSRSTALDFFVDGLRSWEAEFTQTVTDTRGRVAAPIRGKLWIERPGRFRWQLGLPEPMQVMVADGLNLWFHDLDLEQVTVRRATDSMSATPASLLAGTTPLREGFSLEPLPRRTGLDWVRVTPKQADAEFREARLAFDGNSLRRMELIDKLGQSVVLEFTQSKRNERLAAGLMQFTVPEGADLIGTPAGP